MLVVVVKGNNRNVVVVEGNNRNVVVVVEEKGMWCRWYIVSLFTKLCEKLSVGSNILKL